MSDRAVLGRNPFQKFEPDGLSGKKFLTMYWEEAEDQREDAWTDPITGIDRLPVNPRPDDLLNSFALEFDAREVGADGMVEPNLRVAGGGSVYAWWFFTAATVTGERRSKPENLFAMVKQAYSSLWSGNVLDRYPNPYVEVGHTFQSGQDDELEQHEEVVDGRKQLE